MSTQFEGAKEDRSENTDQENPLSMQEGPISGNAEGEAGESRKHAGVGIASFILAALAWILVIVGFVTALPQLMEMSNGANPAMSEQEMTELVQQYPMIMVFGLILMISGGLTFVGLVLGVVGLFMQNRKKLFPVLGTIFNALPIVMIVFFFILGLATGS